MPWLILAVVGMLLAGWALTRLGSLSPAQARALLKSGAVVIDVRTGDEFARQSLPGVINIPLDELRSRMASVVPDPMTPVLLHCRSGGRSGIATQMLRSMGYRQVGNLGSLARAASILGHRPS